MAMNTAIDHTRKKDKFSYSSIDGDRCLELSEKIENRPDRILLNKELDEKVRSAMEKLPTDQRMAIVLREVEGLSYQEMAEVMGCSTGTVMSRLHYGRKKIQEWLKEYMEPHIKKEVEG
jgi:RNA polymerase sigma-70 factor (ECF subfamily)